RAEVHDPYRVQPAGWEPVGIEVEVRAVVADEEVARGGRREDEREQRRARDLLQEAQVEPGLAAALADLVAEDVVADGAREARLAARPRRAAGQVPWGAAGTREPALAVVLPDEIGEGFAEDDDAWQRHGRHGVPPRRYPERCDGVKPRRAVRGRRAPAA